MIEIKFKETANRPSFMVDANTIKEILKKAIEYGADLTGADLFRANLADANLADANLAEANLAEANLTGANLRGARLDNADITAANQFHKVNECGRIERNKDE